MKRDPLKGTIVILGAIIFNFIFWKEKPGVNTIIFDAFILAAIFSLYPFSIKSKTCRRLALGHVVSVAMVVVHNTMVSEIACTVTLLLLVAFSQYLHRSVWYAAGSAILNYVLAIPNFF